MEDIDNQIEWDIKSDNYKVGRRGKSSSGNEIILKSYSGNSKLIFDQ